jgi:hypothetical protein
MGSSPWSANLKNFPCISKLKISNLVDLSTVAAIQNSNRSWGKIQSALWVSIQSALTPGNPANLKEGWFDV